MRYERKTVIEKKCKGGTLTNFGQKNFFLRFLSNMVEIGQEITNIEFL